MRRVILKMHVSLDGDVRGPTGDVTGWIFRTYDDELMDLKPVSGRSFPGGAVASIYQRMPSA